MAKGGGARRCLVTGGAGFIGSHLVRALLDRGDDITVIDDLSTGRRDNLAPDHERLRFHEGRVGDVLGSLGHAAFDVVFHFAAAVGVSLVMRDRIGSIRTNIDETDAVLRYAEASGSGRVLLASSSEVYGRAGGERQREDDDAVYGATTIGRWSYAYSKAIDEHLGLAYHQDRGLDVVIARFFNVVGAGQVGEYGMVVPRFVASALAGRDLEVHGDGTQSRCFYDVRDAVAVIKRLSMEPSASGLVVNVGSDSLVTIGELAALVIEVTGSTSSTRLIPYVAAYGAGFEDLRSRRPDLTRLTGLIGEPPMRPLRETVESVASWMRASTGVRA